MAGAGSGFWGFSSLGCHRPNKTWEDLPRRVEGGMEEQMRWTEFGGRDSGAHTDSPWGRATSQGLMYRWVSGLVASRHSKIPFLPAWPPKLLDHAHCLALWGSELW